MFWALAVIAAFFAVYSFLDHSNRIIGHIITAILATILFFLLGTTMIAGNVADVQSVAVTQVTNNTTVDYTYDTVEVPMQDIPVGYMFVFGGVVMLIVTILSILELVSDMVSFKRGGGYDDEEY
jgi:small-conductance mechanosensitive channel